MGGEVFEESEGPIEDILGERKDKILYIPSICCDLGPFINNIYLFNYLGKGSPLPFGSNTSWRAARDGSLTARATGRHTHHILFSLLAVLSNARLSPSHATSQPQLFYHCIHIYLRSHQINTLTFHPCHLSVSFYVFW